MRKVDDLADKACSKLHMEVDSMAVIAAAAGKIIELARNVNGLAAGVHSITSYRLTFVLYSNTKYHASFRNLYYDSSSR